MTTVSAAPAATALAQEPEPQQLTREAFAAGAIVNRLTNHGRRWQVQYGSCFSIFSDADNADGAVADAHQAAVNNALYWNLPEMAGAMETPPSVPPAAVLAQYPDLVARFAGLGLLLTLPNEATQ